ncbi:hypothetical protein WJX73_004561 [Symbiochloris irregularis]|uniref:Uncharacterized protein n=1 Tax=Symbiochloris irregularis TaxID=706552 RepID=A0AAW1PG88_9CHLO
MGPSPPVLPCSTAANLHDRLSVQTATLKPGQLLRASWREHAENGSRQLECLSSAVVVVQLSWFFVNGPYIFRKYSCTLSARCRLSPADLVIVMPKGRPPAHDSSAVSGLHLLLSEYEAGLEICDPRANQQALATEGSNAAQQTGAAVQSPPGATVAAEGARSVAARTVAFSGSGSGPDEGSSGQESHPRPRPGVSRGRICSGAGVSGEEPAPGSIAAHLAALYDKDSDGGQSHSLLSSRGVHSLLLPSEEAAPVKQGSAHVAPGMAARDAASTFPQPTGWASAVPSSTQPTSSPRGTHSTSPAAADIQAASPGIDVQGVKVATLPSGPSQVSLLPQAPLRRGQQWVVIRLHQGDGPQPAEQPAPAAPTRPERRLVGRLKSGNKLILGYEQRKGDWLVRVPHEGQRIPGARCATETEAADAAWRLAHQLRRSLKPTKPRKPVPEAPPHLIRPSSETSGFAATLPASEIQNDVALMQRLISDGARLPSLSCAPSIAPEPVPVPPAPVPVPAAGLEKSWLSMGMLLAAAADESDDEPDEADSQQAVSTGHACALQDVKLPAMSPDAADAAHLECQPEDGLYGDTMRGLFIKLSSLSKALFYSYSRPATERLPASRLTEISATIDNLLAQLGQVPASDRNRK